MTDNQVSGLALIAGSVGSIITMSLHPSGRIAPEQMEPMIRMLIGVHALALAGVPVLFVGAWGLSRRGPGRDRLTIGALVLYTFALLAVMNAAVADGLVTPNILLRLGIYGCILGVVTLLALFSGRLRLDTHGFGAVMFAQAAWFIIAGSLLWRTEELAVTAAN